MRRRARLVVLALLTAALPLPAAADPPAPNLDETLRLMREAAKQADEGHAEPARQLYMKACALMPTPRCLRSLASTDLEAGHPVEALKHFREELAHPRASVDLTPDKLERDRKLLRDAYAQAGHVEIRASEGATIALDGQPLGDPLPADRVVDVLPGPHAVEARLADHVARVDVTATPGAIVAADLTIELHPAALPAPPAVPPQQPLPISNPAEATDAGVSRESWWTTTRTAGLLTAGGGVASFALSGLFASQSRSAARSADTLRPCVGPCGALQDDDATEARAKTLDWIFFGVGAAAVATGAVLFFWPQPSHGNIAPLATSNTAGLQVTGEFQ